MKKGIALVLVAVMLSTVALALTFETYKLNLIAKDPATWEECESTFLWLNTCPRGEIAVKYFGYDVNFYGKSLEPKTDYTLIYYGDETHNDVWPYATCILAGTSDYRGQLSMRGRYNMGAMFNDAVGQKIWLVLSDDVDCDAGKMVVWNPTEYLFEHNLI